MGSILRGCEDRMKRDMDMIRLIMLEVEKWPVYGGDNDFASLSGLDPASLQYNVYQAIQSGLLEGECFSTLDPSEGRECVVHGITPDGHDFLDSARDKYIWNEVNETIEGQGDRLGFGRDFEGTARPGCEKEARPRVIALH